MESVEEPEESVEQPGLELKVEQVGQLSVESTVEELVTLDLELQKQASWAVSVEEPGVPHAEAEVRPMSEAEKAALERRFPAGSAVPLLLSGTRLLDNLTACLLMGGPDGFGK